MSITLTLPPEVQSLVEQQAEKVGLSIEDYVVARLRGGLESRHETDQGERRRLSDEQWKARLKAWADSFPPCNHVVDDSRESIYVDRT